MRLRKVAFTAFMLAVSLWILLPTADEIIIHPTFGLFLSYVFNIPLAYGILLSIIIYRIIGLICLSLAMIVGGKPIYNDFKGRFRNNVLRKINKNDPARTELNPK